MMIKRALFSRAFRVCGLALAVGATALVVMPADAAYTGGTNRAPVCAYLAVVNGTSSIDPHFVPGAKPAVPPATGGPFGAGAVPLASSVATASSAGAPTDSAYCHPIPPLVPIGR